MNFGTNPYDIAFLAFAPALAFFSLRCRRRSEILLALAVAAVVGWGLGFAGQAWIDAQWDALLERTPNPSTELIEQINSDSASKATLLIFGLPISLAYSAVWFTVIRGVRRAIKRLIHA